MAFECVLNAWQTHEKELLGFLYRHLGEHSLAEDLLQDVFIKAMKQGSHFCSLDNPRAWLFRVARTTLIDHTRLTKPDVVLTEDLSISDAQERDAIDELDICISRNLPHLPTEDRFILEACHLHGLTVSAFAEREGLSLPAAKSRLLRARRRLRDALVQYCQVQFDEQGRVCCHIPKKIEK
ncbi:sigma-70 family RNA polymerase sigma factor [Pectobacteriaceae bacterium CE90]|nr:sigma-70 family RNA polymerase sigma factor [Prodigiosinella sp. LS101]WJV53873.1 sigma-70 family RNA polymerase sigma factor [Prodigiosinella sp. LS101]WJV58236.1 sigma-70 family RNA polymerase sigma factor [Pectobacteriaceae bacterium C111]WJY15149.1 sigma-70 family RNA polymerase sigma factor [Pectobacteriaceae bacterium CE90]